MNIYIWIALIVIGLMLLPYLIVLGVLVIQGIAALLFMILLPIYGLVKFIKWIGSLIGL